MTTTDDKFVELLDQINKRLYSDNYRPVMEDATFLLGEAIMLAFEFRVERDIAVALAPYADHAADCAVEVESPCDCGLARIFDRLPHASTDPPGASDE